MLTELRVASGHAVRTAATIASLAIIPLVSSGCTQMPPAPRPYVHDPMYDQPAANALAGVRGRSARRPAPDPAVAESRGRTRAAESRPARRARRSGRDSNGSGNAAYRIRHATPVVAPGGRAGIGKPRGRPGGWSPPEGTELSRRSGDGSAGVAAMETGRSRASETRNGRPPSPSLESVDPRGSVEGAEMSIGRPGDSPVGAVRNPGGPRPAESPSPETGREIVRGERSGDDVSEMTRFVRPRDLQRPRARPGAIDVDEIFTDFSVPPEPEPFRLWTPCGHSRF